VQIIDDCPWKAVMEIWPNQLVSLTDAALATVALSNRYDAVATFDRKLAKRMQDLGVAAYW
jgi:rRNA-processing protein FCF1